VAHILIADDDKITRQLLKTRLLRRGHSVEEAKDGKEAVETAKKDKPDIVVLDITMPVMNGIDALKILKSEESTKGIDVLIATNIRQDLSSYADTLKLAQDVVKKYENSPDDIVRRVEEILGAKDFF